MSERQKRPLSGEHAAVEARHAEDGSIELIVTEPTRRATQPAPEPQATPSLAASPRRRAVLLGAGALALCGLIAAAALSLRSPQKTQPEDLVKEWSSTLPQASFKAYEGSDEPQADAAPKALPRPQVKRPADEDLSPEEREAWRLAEAIGQDVVYEDEGQAQPQALYVAPARVPVNPANIRGVDDSRLMSPEAARPNPKQIELLREMNRQLTADPEGMRAVKVDSALNARLKQGLPYKLKPIKPLPINPNPPSGEHELPKVPNPTYLPDVYGDGPMPGTNP